jgi:glycosyltransferase involved in cell wall biosynthesis
MRERVEGQPLVVGFLGHQNRFKGYSLVPSLADSLLERRQGIRLLIHDAAPIQNAEEAAKLRARAKVDDRIDLVFEPIGGKLWWDLLNRVDLLVLPYMPERYIDAYSAMLAEAISCGLPVVAPAGTALSELLESMGLPGVLFESWEEDKIFAAIEEALVRFDELAFKANRAAAVWMRTNGPGPLINEILYGGVPKPDEGPFDQGMGHGTDVGESIS